MPSESIQFFKEKKPILIAGPCMAESWELLDHTCSFLTQIAKQHQLKFIFKASFDKANRSSYTSRRGPGLIQAMKWFRRLKEKYHCLITTDVHETQQVNAVAEVCDVLQIPAFLCRQTDLITAAVRTQRAVTVKKGQFISPYAAKHIADKLTHASENSEPNFAIIERGVVFGYEHLIVDMRGFKIMRDLGFPIIFDVTHSTQQPGSGDITQGAREFAPLLARAAAATGYIDGLFMEVHPDPKQALSDAATQLNFEQAHLVIEQAFHLLRDGLAYVREEKKLF